MNMLYLAGTLPPVVEILPSGGDTVCDLNITLKDSGYIEIDGLSSVKCIGSDKTVTFDKDKFTDVPLRDGVTYVFAGKSLTASLCGAEIKYLLFSTDT